MPETINPQFLYYMLLFLLTVILRFIRTYKLQEKTWHNYLFFSFEFVNVSAGVFIILSEQATNFVSAIMMTYVILVVVSFFLDDERVGLKLKTSLHALVSLIVIFFTCYSFLYIIKPTPRATDANTTVASSSATYKAFVKYLDVKYDAAMPLCVEYSDINATSIEDARQKAIKACQDPTQPPVPRKRGVEKTSHNIQCVDAVVELVKINK